MAFVKSRDRAENYKSSAYSLILVGALGLIFLVLCFCNVIKLNLSRESGLFCSLVLLLMFLAFIYIGIRSLVYAKTLTALSDTEEDIQDRIDKYFEENVTKESVDSLAFTTEDKYLSDEAKYFNREEVVKKIISDNFGSLDESFLDSETERMINKIF